MKKLLVTALASVTVVLAACNEPEKDVATTPTLESQPEKLSYSYGWMIGQQMKNDGLKLQDDAFMLAINDALSDKDQRIEREEMMAVIQSEQQRVQAERQVEAKKVAEESLAKGQAFLDENAKKEGVVVLESGLQYKILEDADGPVPAEENTVSVHYRGTLIDGTEFDSSYKNGNPVQFPVTGVIPGWVEALQLMPEGSKWELYIPAELAYGPGGTRSIPPNSVLVFEVELLDANTADNEETEESADS